MDHLTLSPDGPVTVDAAAERARQSRLSAGVPFCAVAVLAVSGVVLAVWLTRGPEARHALAPLLLMKLNTAAILLLLSVALLGLRRDTPLLRAVAGVCAAAATGLALLILSRYALGIDLHIDNLLVTDDAAVAYPGRTSAGSAGSAAMVGVAFLLLLARRNPVVIQSLLLVALVTPMATLGGYLYGTPGLSVRAPYPIVALHTSGSLLLLCLDGLFVRPGVGLTAVIVSSSMAGALARKLLPLAAIVPMATGLLVLLGIRTELFGVAFGSALLVSVCAVLFAAAVWWTTSVLWIAEQTRGAALARRDAAEAAGDRVLEALIEERAKVQTALEAEQSARAAAEQADRAKDEFLATLSHELRTPLNAILGWTQVLQSGQNLPPDLQQGLAVIERNGRAQAQIIADLLDMSGIISGKVRLTVTAVDLCTVVTDTLQSVRLAADVKGVRLAHDCPPGVPIRGDAARLQQVVWNLLSNAIKFTPAGGRVDVRLTREDTHTRLAVTDTGDGIAEPFLPFVFDRFRQADSSTTRQHGGLGLGLSIVKQLVELHGGTVAVTSDGPGRGTSVAVVLPVAANPPAVAPDTADAAPAAAVERAPRLIGLTVLVIDDETDARELVRRMLEAAGAKVDTAGSAAEAWSRLGRQAPDVIVSDIGMPGEDGLSLIRRVRALAPHAGGRTPAVALTAYAATDDRRNVIAAGYQAHLPKPVERADLLACVARLAEGGSDSDAA